MSAIDESEQTGGVVWLGDENSRVQAWRYTQLVRGGYFEHEAAQLAAHVEIDLHVALDFVRRGCPPETAARILL